MDLGSFFGLLPKFLKRFGVFLYSICFVKFDR